MNQYIITEEVAGIIETALESDEHCKKCPYEGGGFEQGALSLLRECPYQSERDCPVCGGGLMCHRWCIDRDCGWDSIPVGRLTMTPPQCPGFILAETTDGLVLSYWGEEFTVDDDMRKDLIAYLEIQSRRDKVLDALEIPFKELLKAIGTVCKLQMALPGDYNVELGEAIQVCFDKFGFIDGVIAELREEGEP